MPSQTSEAYVWLWQPGSSEPVVAGIVQRARDRYRFAYAPSYLARHDAISLYQPELPLGPGWIEPSGGLTIAGTLRDAGPDAWGQRVIIQGLFGNADAVDPGDVDQVTYFLSSASNRIGALDFQESPVTYVEREGSATLDELHGAARNLADGRDLTPEMATALVHGTSVGGARPKVTITDGDRAYIAKLSTSTDPYPVVKAEAVGLELARRVGIDAPSSIITSSLGHEILLVERFDRPGAGCRQMMVSGLTMLGLDEMNGRYATYPDLLDVLRRHGADPNVGKRLFERIVFNVAIGNNDDHARNHAAFWDGESLDLTPAYDLCPQARTGETSAQAMAIDRTGNRDSSLRLCVEAAHIYGVDRREGLDVIGAQVEVIREAWDDVADANRLTIAERNYLLGRQVLNPSTFYDLPTA
ncbi:MAG: HipA domain-containing protein [Microthrixaceae bacterium]|nr:HipA domain-containing protein [Microthrixaceae bacterium]